MAGLIYAVFKMYIYEQSVKMHDEFISFGIMSSSYNKELIVVTVLNLNRPQKAGDVTTWDHICVITFLKLYLVNHIRLILAFLFPC